jgi:hypothetical protein
MIRVAGVFAGQGGEGYREACAFAGLRFDGELSVVFADDLLRDGEAQAGAFLALAGD